MWAVPLVSRFYKNVTQVGPKTETHQSYESSIPGRRSQSNQPSHSSSLTTFHKWSALVERLWVWNRRHRLLDTVSTAGKGPKLNGLWQFVRSTYHFCS